MPQERLYIYSHGERAPNLSEAWDRLKAASGVSDEEIHKVVNRAGAMKDTLQIKMVFR